MGTTRGTEGHPRDLCRVPLSACIFPLLLTVLVSLSVVPADFFFSFPAYNLRSSSPLSPPSVSFCFLLFVLFFTGVQSRCSSFYIDSSFTSLVTHAHRVYLVPYRFSFCSSLFLYLSRALSPSFSLSSSRLFSLSLSPASRIGDAPLLSLPRMRE